ncbi:MAG: glutamate--tRNA ligase [Candidatus Limnocylindria bacterium]
MTEIRLRFAPSPTGSLHIGSVRTTLYNYFFARQNGGQLVLRIEDTDQGRFDPRALDTIYDGLHWMGIRWDEGPREGGGFGPYVQSERLPLYQRHAEALVNDAAAYHCFCTKERLAAVRSEQAARGEITRYDRHCRSIPAGEARERAAREKHVVRLKVPDDGEVAIDDLVYGHVSWPLRAIEDQVLLKSDGFPTYQLAVVIDDHEMRISHVFRGEDWLPSTPKHLLVYRAFGWEVPPHAHLPNVLGPDGRKLAKRHGATAVSEFRDEGYLPEALVNFLALIGWSPGSEDEIFTMQDLVERWRIDHVQRAGGKWDRDRLDWFDGIHIRRLEPDELVARLGPFVPKEWDRVLLRAVVPFVQERMRTLAEAKDLVAFLFTDELSYDELLLVPKKRDRASAVDALTRAESVLSTVDPFEGEALETALRGVAEALAWKPGELFMVVRVALMGRTVGPPIDSVALLGRERAVARMRDARMRLEAQTATT